MQKLKNLIEPIALMSCISFLNESKIILNDIRKYKIT
jgi:hypothetical protein